MITQIRVMVTLDDLISFIMEETSSTYDYVEEALPNWIYEDGTCLGQDGYNSSAEIFASVRKYLIANDIEHVWVFQDC